MINKPVTLITAADIQALLDENVLESKTLEYKRQLPLSSDKDKKEFLADASSFANAGGGDLLFGVEANDGQPTAILGLKQFNEDKDVLRLESSIRDGIEPRIQGIQFESIGGFELGPVLLIRMPKSWAAPHMVSFKGTSRFFTRSSAGKFQMDVDELRAAFEGAGRLPERITSWRSERVGRIIANEGAMPLPETGRLILHLVPVAQFDEASAISAEKLYESFAMFPPLGESGGGRRLNLDGVVTFGGDTHSMAPVDSYTQVFRNGCVEAVCSNLIRSHSGQSEISSVQYEAMIIDSVTKYLSGFEAVGIAPPILCFLTIQGALGASFQVSSPLAVGHHRIDRDPLILPDVTIDDLSDPVPTILRPVFDMVWNACGYLRSFNYDDNGKWVGR